MQHTVRLVTLGECAVEVGETRVGPEAEVIYAALLVLAFEAGRRIPRQELVQLLWPSAEDGRARHSLRQTLYRIRQLGVELESTALDVCLPASRVRADFVELESGTPDGGVATLASVGDVLPSYAPSLSPAFTKRLERYRGTVHAHVRRRLLSALAESRKGARWDETEQLARRCLQLDPLNEAATLALAEATAMSGNKAQALAILDRYTSEVAAGTGAEQQLMRVQPAILRRRIAERIPERRYGTAAEAEFVGREDSIAYLSTLFDDARLGRGRGCLLWGDAGIGKTRLVSEFTDAAALRGARIQRVGCQPSDVHRPLSVFVDVVPALLNLPGALGCSPESMSYLKRLTEHDRSSTTPSEASREAEYLYGRVRRALLDLIDAIAAECTLVLVVEDVHWLDPMSWSVLRETIEWASSRRLMVIMTSRTPKTEDDPPRWAGRPLERHQLGPLAEWETARVVASLLRGVEHSQQVDESMLARWTDLADGNPLFARELVQQWLATGDAEKLPESLLALVDARVARLPKSALRVLQVCGVLGKNASLERIHHILDYPAHQLLDAIDELHAAGILESDASLAWASHHLVIDAAHRRLTAGAKRALQWKTAATLEQEIDSTASASLLWDCTSHWQAAGEVDRAMSLAMARAAYLLNLGLPREAAEIYERLLELDGSEERQEQVLGHLQHALTASSQWTKLLRVLDRLESLHERAGRHCHHSELELVRIYAHWITNGDLQSLGAQAAACVVSEGLPIAHRVEAASLALALAWSAGDQVRFRLVSNAIRPFLGSVHVPEATRAHVELIMHTLSQQIEESVDAARRLIALERVEGNSIRLARALRHASNAFIQAGMVEETISALLEAIGIHEQNQSLGQAISTAVTLGQHYLNLGDLALGREWYARALKWHRGSDDSQPWDALSFLGARIALLEGAPAEARRRFGRSFEHIRDDHLPLRRIEALSIWVRIQLADGARPAPEALELLQRDLHALSWTHDRDYDFHTLYLALCEMDREPEAGRLIINYVTRLRRWRTPLYFELATAIVECEPLRHSGNQDRGSHCPGGPDGE